jgi:hypothetical protein
MLLVLNLSRYIRVGAKGTMDLQDNDPRNKLV